MLGVFFGVLYLGLIIYLDPLVEQDWIILGMGAVLGVAGLALVLQAREDPHRFCVITLALSLVAATVAGPMAIFVPETHPVSTSIAMGSGAIAAASIYRIVRNQTARDPLPGSLRERFPGHHIYEVAGVQFVMEPGEKVVISGEQVDLQIPMQNCWDRERVVTLPIVEYVRISLSKAGLAYQSPHEVVLEGGVVGTLHLPVLAETGSRGRFVLRIRPRIEGNDGVRVRPWRAQLLARWVPAWIGLLVPHFLVVPPVGENELKFRIRVVEGGTAPASEPALPEATWVVDYSPDPEKLQEASFG